MAHLVSLSSSSEKKPSEGKVAAIDFPGADSQGPRWTQVQKITVFQEVHQEWPDPGSVRFFYVLQGEGDFSSGGIKARVRQGSCIFLEETEDFSLAPTSERPLLLLRFRIKSGAGVPDLSE